MTRALALLLLALAAGPALAQADGRPLAADTVRSADGGEPSVGAGGASRVPTPLEAVTGSWSEAFSELAVLARTLDEYPATPAGRRGDARISLALHAASIAGGLVESTRFSVTFAVPEAAREANVALLENGFALAYHLGRIAHEATEGPDDGSEPDWSTLAATARAMALQTRASLAAVGVVPR